jgi:hypothetical protein
MDRTFYVTLFPILGFGYPVGGASEGVQVSGLLSPADEAMIKKAPHVRGFPDFGYQVSAVDQSYEWQLVGRY